MSRKGLSQNALTLILGIMLMLFVLMVNTAFAPSDSFKEFMKKVPFLNKIIPEPGSDNPLPIDQINVCGGICNNKGPPCLIEQRCTNADPKTPLIGTCVADAECAKNIPSGNILILSAVTSGGDGVYYTIYDETDPLKTYQTSAGDCLQYDVWIANDAGGIGGINIVTSDGKSWGGEDKWTDKNEQKASMKPADKLHQKGEDISDFAYRRWHKRQIPILTDVDPDKTMAGRSVKSVRLVTEQAGYSRVPVVAYYDNIKFVSCDNQEIVKKVIFDNSLQADGPVSKSGFRDVKLDIFNYDSMAKLPDYHNHGAQVLQFEASNPDGKNYVYWRVGGPGVSPYTVQRGDTIEYDVCIVSNSAEIGGIDVFKNDADTDGWRDIDKRWPSNVDCSEGAKDGMANDWRDQNLIDGHPKCDLRQKYSKTIAFGKWYHRVMLVPSSKVNDNAKIAYLDLVSDSDNSGPFTVYYDNIFITNADKIKQTIYQDGAPSINEKHFSDGSYTATLTAVSPPPPAVCTPADALPRSFVQ